MDASPSTTPDARASAPSAWCSPARSPADDSPPTGARNTTGRKLPRGEAWPSLPSRGGGRGPGAAARSCALLAVEDRSAVIAAIQGGRAGLPAGLDPGGDMEAPSLSTYVEVR